MLKKNQAISLLMDTISLAEKLLEKTSLSMDQLLKNHTLMLKKLIITDSLKATGILNNLERP